jgi:hypothetical protein
MSNGFIPVRRSLFDHFLFNEHRVFSRFEAWLDLIQMASFTDDNKVMIAGKLIERNRGEVVASLRYLMQRWNWSMSKVCDYLELLRSQQMVIATKENGVTKLLLVNFEKHNSLAERDSKKDSKSRNQTGFDQNKETAKSTQTGTPREQPGDSEGANNKKGNKDKKENGDGADAPTHSPDEEILFNAFSGWIEKYASKVNKMKEPLTIDQYLRLRTDFPGEKGRALLQEVILSMHNHKQLLKKYESANLTLRSWIRLRNKDGKTNEITVNTGPTARELEEAENRKKLGIDERKQAKQ